jgi:hypothetical protein
MIGNRTIPEHATVSFSVTPSPGRFASSANPRRECVQAGFTAWPHRRATCKRYSESLPDNIPHCDPDRADCAIQDRTTTPPRVSKHTLPQKYDFGRIFVDEEAPVFENRLRYRGFPAGGGAWGRWSSGLNEKSVGGSDASSASASDYIRFRAWPMPVSSLV